jgi:hypothetical protein
VPRQVELGRSTTGAIRPSFGTCATGQWFQQGTVVKPSNASKRSGSQYAPVSPMTKWRYFDLRFSTWMLPAWIGWLPGARSPYGFSHDHVSVSPTMLTTVNGSISPSPH